MYEYDSFSFKANILITISIQPIKIYTLRRNVTKKFFFTGKYRDSNICYLLFVVYTCYLCYEKTLFIVIYLIQIDFLVK